MVVLRLSRVGKKNHATWRLIVSDRRQDTSGTYLELLGSYDPHQVPASVRFNADRVKYWLSVGAQASPTVRNLLIDQGIIPGPKLPRKMVKRETPAATPTAPSPEASAAAEPEKPE